MASQYGSKSSNVIIIPDSPPAKRRKILNGDYQTTNTSNGYDSEADSGDDLFEGIITTPPAKYLTQPTQLIDRPKSSSSADTDISEVQVPVSSPFRPNLPTASKPSHTIQHGGRLANLMAPAGTTFRAPPKVWNSPVKKHHVIDLSDDDGPQYKGGSSDDDGSSKANLKPSAFKRGGSSTSPQQPNSSSAGSKAALFNGNSHFASVMASSRYKPEQRSMEVKNRERISQVQSRPERAMPVGQDSKLFDSESPDGRRKINRIRGVMPASSYAMIRRALEKTKGHVEDAMALLSDQPPDELSEDEIRGLNDIENPKPEPQMKRELNAPAKSIAEKWSSYKTQEKAPVSPKPATPAKPKRRLMQGRRHPTSPAIPVVDSPEPRAVAAISVDSSDGDASDSDIDSDGGEDIELEDRVLSFLNKCEVRELADLANIKEEVATMMLSHRPFKTLDSARKVSDAKVTKSGKRSTKAPVGEKIVQIAVDMWSGYEAVDALVAKCEELGKPLTKEMAKWGLDVFGAAKHGELEMVTLEEDDEAFRDSGIGTPSSKAASQNGDVRDDEVKVIARKGRHMTFLKKPANMSDDITLKDYQIVGLNWLYLLYRHKLSCILADDMGLGKTCQVIAFLSHLAAIGETGPHLVIVPPSTLENWLREFQFFSPGLAVEPYYGSQSERAELAMRILENRDEVNVVVSTYEFAAKKDDNRFMRQLRPNVCVYDEGHVLKNPKSLKYQGLIRIPADFRLLLTGTPLQNNLMELAALLGFILPSVFRDRQEDLEFIFKHKASTRDSDHAALLSNQRIARAKSMLTPFVLRRKKDQVLKHMPAKTCRVEYCDLAPSQAEIYESFLAKAREREKLREQGIVLRDTDNNPLMQLRKAAIHAMLFRRHFTQDKLEKMLSLLKKHEPSEFSQPRDKIMLEMQAFSDFYLHIWCRLYPCIRSFDVADLTWMNSGKVQTLVRLLDQYKSNGDRVLIFSQFTLVLDILEEVLQTASIEFMRFDGATKVNERQSIIDNFRDDTTITAFLLSTGAGGTGVNLMFANKVIIFDSSFNPQDDVQAENRAHRVGQTREVEVVRLVTKGTIEEQIYALGQSKLALDSKVVGGGDAESKGEQMVAKMLLQNQSLESLESAAVVE